MVWFGMAGLLFAAEPSAPADAAPVATQDSAADAEEGEGGALPGGPDPLGADALPANPAVSAVPLGQERWTIPADVLDAVRAARDRSIGERIEAATRAFLGLPYLNDAAGELDATDADPPSRYEAFDCLTFVEEALGLALAGDPLYAPAVRDALRYRGAPAYETRRHFMEAQWIPDAIANGLVEDITARVGRARVLRKDVTLDTWKRWARRALFRLPDAALPVGPWSLTYLDLAEAVEAAPRIPAGALIVTLRAERAWKPVVVTHISIAVPPAAPDGETRMRHATRMGRRTVRDDRLPWYVAHLRDYTNWPALGITVLMPREQGPRISALTTVTLPAPFPFAEGPVPDLASLSGDGGAGPPRNAPPIPGSTGSAATVGTSAGAVPVDPAALDGTPDDGEARE